MDKLEVEQGDLEEIDENKVRRDLEKIHMYEFVYYGIALNSYFLMKGWI